MEIQIELIYVRYDKMVTIVLMLLYLWTLEKYQEWLEILYNSYRALSFIKPHNTQAN